MHSTRPRLSRQTGTEQPHVGRRRLLLAAAAAAAGGRVVPACASTGNRAAVDVTLERRADEFIVVASAVVGASCEQAWATLSDYDHLADFIPDVLSSHTVVRTGARVVVAQRARAKFWPFRQDFALVMEVRERTNESIRAQAIEGDFRRFEARYDLARLDASRTRIEYQATLQPVAAVPPLVGVAVLRALIRRQFEAMVAEIVRRAASA